MKDESLEARRCVVYMLRKIGPPAIDAVPDLIQALRTAEEHPDINSSPGEMSFILITLLALEEISPGVGSKYSSEILDRETIQD